jgi:hypothetical protein
MTREDIIRMAKEAKLPYEYDTGRTLYLKELERFAALVASADREACAQVCDGIRYSGYCPPEDGGATRYYDEAAEECAAAIRAKGQP